MSLLPGPRALCPCLSAPTVSRYPESILTVSPASSPGGSPWGGHPQEEGTALPSLLQDVSPGAGAQPSVPLLPGQRLCPHWSCSGDSRTPGLCPTAEPAQEPMQGDTRPWTLSKLVPSLQGRWGRRRLRSEMKLRQLRSCHSELCWVPAVDSRAGTAGQGSPLTLGWLRSHTGPLAVGADVEAVPESPWSHHRRPTVAGSAVGSAAWRWQTASRGPGRGDWPGSAHGGGGRAGVRARSWPVAVACVQTPSVTIPDPRSAGKSAGFGSYSYLPVPGPVPHHAWLHAHAHTYTHTTTHGHTHRSVDTHTQERSRDCRPLPLPLS